MTIERIFILRIFFLLSALTVAFPCISFAQDVSTQRWNYIYTYFPITDEINYHADYGDRNEFPARNYIRLHARPALRFYMKDNDIFSFEAGFGFFRVWQEPISDTYEFRPYFGYHFDWPIYKRLFFSWRFRYEERFIYADEADAFSTSLRLRFRGKLVVPINNKREQDKTWFAFTTYEFFENIGSTEFLQYIDQTRWEIGGGYRFSSHFKITLVYLRRTNYNNADTPRDDELDHIIRTGFYFDWID
jgi:hypothetical protein